MGARIEWLLLMAMLAAVACAANPQVVDHGFAFDTTRDGQNAVVLDYRYGTSRLAQAPEWAVKEGRVFTFENVHGPMARGDFLYVKWRDTASGQIYEDTVDLRGRLPEDIAHHTLYFMISGSRLYVYLISPADAQRPSDADTEGPRLYRERKIVRIYPG